MNAQLAKAFDLVRRAMWRRWVTNVTTSWQEWLQHNLDHIKSTDGSEIATLLKERGTVASSHAAQSLFWAWDQGSAIFFWRWPREYFWDVALGVPPNWIGIPKPTITEQRNLGEATIIKQIADKIADVRKKGYIADGHCVATMNFLAVLKGETDIRMVYDGTNLYAPWFPLPDAGTLTNTLDDQFWCIDNDHGECS